MTEVIVFDLDETLISNDSTKIWITRCLKSNILRFSLALLIMPLAMLLMKIKKYKIIGSSLFLWVATFGLDKKQLQTQIKQFAQDIKLGHIKNVYWYNDGLMTLKQHLKEGKTVIIVTAAPEILAQALIHSLDLSVSVLGTPLKRRLGGWVGYAHCRHMEKVKRLSLIGVKQPWYASYSDDLIEDYPLLSHCKYPYLINNKQDHLQPDQLNITSLEWS